MWCGGFFFFCTCLNPTCLVPCTQADVGCASSSVPLAQLLTLTLQPTELFQAAPASGQVRISDAEMFGLDEVSAGSGAAGAGKVSEQGRQQTAASMA